jgi:hypothetical protein
MLYLHEYNQRKHIKESKVELVIHHIPIGILIAQYIQRDKNLIASAMAVISGLYIADALSGVLHYFFDHYTGDIPVLCDEARVFQEHHIPPYAINKSAISVALHNAIIIPPPILAAYINYKYRVPSHIIIGETLILYGLYMSDFVHGLCHDKRDNRFVKWLRKRRIILDKQTHLTHHESLNSNYCMLNGWANPLVNSLSNIWKNK